ncbi:MAG TPA: hypothetical protein VG435_14350 [Acidimicrobiales bacterium]|nr:hypothetical protein [Acidimicrobiales bacterium]
MERDLFVDAEGQGWWLLEDDLDDQLDGQRHELGTSFGWTDLAWYKQRTNLETLYTFLSTEQDALLRSLDEAIDDDKRRSWLDELLSVRAPEDDGAEAEPAGAEAEAPSEPATTEEAGLEAEDQTPAPPLTPEPPKKSSIFKSKAQEVEAPEPETAGTAPGGDAPVAEAESAGTAPADDAEGAAGSAEDTPAAPPTPEEIQALVADPEIPLTQEEVDLARSEPDFEAKLAEAEAALEAELEAEVEAELEAELAEMAEAES